ncbi:hypothetical protein K431DRAFT_87875 [Polychaeton citri CBS 116435]|uniref:Uncharacterized protein n=1 Tax=Polychaeton citri CBS 116435 TaxID=1314669 RepID=A0A9P4UQA0_9PEZI|nr:hypothetical protein K431DRAFT_87875 [Polychaeton citri CBS 116435]
MPCPVWKSCQHCMLRPSGLVALPATQLNTVQCPLHGKPSCDGSSPMWVQRAFPCSTASTLGVSAYRRGRLAYDTAITHSRGISSVGPSAETRGRNTPGGKSGLLLCTEISGLCVRAISRCIARARMSSPSPS